MCFRLSDLAQQIVPKTTMKDPVLPEKPKRQLREIVRHIKNLDKVHKRRGFAVSSSRGSGVSALFVGPTGSEKIMAAEVLANELQLPLFRIELSTVVSKYIGETEKNLQRIFDAAEDGAAILFFDEADALFGKRSEVRDSHDRYANTEIMYLLQRMENYRGLAILATNAKNSGSAFMRRLRFAVNFPFPDEKRRSR
jgi:SpoVK/Ycf46/Vps4 family AAA+-type ATPase